MTATQKIIAYAEWYIGQLEKKGNSGFVDPKFEKEMIGAGWQKGDPWCASFVRMVALKVFTGELQAAVRSQFNASAKQTFDRVKKAGIFATGDQPEEGAIAVWLNGKGPAGHIGIVKTVNLKTNTMNTIEGNTNASGSREGDRVAAKPRTIKRDFAPSGLNVYGYIYLRLKDE
ncbi:CHAP domain-containing protein [Pedobacter antarcticus]|uniref:CHAP domain-containing protein n=1 Tax=Pedobacter antarcticus TaxID=34086 RepID=UPI0029304733|nr:CHAP domain-containing protein [Pedobacter antarcticus]